MSEGGNTGDSDETVALTIRLPKALHTWLRSEAFFGSTTMAEIVREELEARRAASEEAGHELVQPAPPGQLMPDSAGGWISGPCVTGVPAAG